MIARTGLIAAACLVIALALAAFVSPHASGRPDGLEATLEALSPEDGTPETSAQPTAAPLDDYAVPGVAREGVSRAFAGVIGTAFAFAVAYGLLKLVTRGGSRPPS